MGFEGGGQEGDGGWGSDCYSIADTNMPMAGHHRPFVSLCISLALLGFQAFGGWRLGWG